jgi:hypothetical protein
MSLVRSSSSYLVNLQKMTTTGINDIQEIRSNALLAWLSVCLQSLPATIRIPTSTVSYDATSRKHKPRSSLLKSVAQRWWKRWTRLTRGWLDSRVTLSESRRCSLLRVGNKQGNVGGVATWQEALSSSVSSIMYRVRVFFSQGASVSVVLSHLP